VVEEEKQVKAYDSFHYCKMLKISTKSCEKNGAENEMAKQLPVMLSCVEKQFRK
jgi:hypothetical protein